ncbi:MAG TPA: glycosyltransferase family 39 protein, partial [Thermoanaerobaculia bacterium]|nr:glycosyltransferase family 39 protein [Thermoanaerobaculia bacterium]
MKEGRSLDVDGVVSLATTSAILVGLVAAAAMPPSQRALQFLVLAAMVAALWQSAARLATVLIPAWPRASRTVATFTLAVGIAVVSGTWMGHFGILRPPTFLFWIAAIYMGTRFIRGRSSPRQDGDEDHTRTSAGDRAQNVLLIAAALAVVVLGLREAHHARYLETISHDDLSYHLSAVATWIRYGDLRMIRFSQGDPSTPFYPLLGEMTSWVLIAPFGDSDVAARWTQLPFALFSWWAVAAIARRLGASTRDAALAALAYAGVAEAFPGLAFSAGNDHALSFFSLAAVDAALGFARDRRTGAAVVAGTAIGLMLATKYIAVLYAPLAVAVLVIAALLSRGDLAGAGSRPFWPDFLRLVLPIAGAICVAGGYTYLRNYVTTGNPIFPAPVRVLGFDLFPSWEGVTAGARASAPEYRIDVWRFLIDRKDLFGSYFAVTLLPAAFLSPLVGLVRRSWLASLVFSLPIAFFLEFRFLMPDHRSIRYFLPAIAIAAVAVSWLLPMLGAAAGALRCGLLLWIAGDSLRRAQGWPPGTKVAVLVGVLLAACLIELGRRWPLWGRRSPPLPSAATTRMSAVTTRRLAAVALVALLARPLGAVAEKYQQRRLGFNTAAATLEQLTKGEGARVAYAGLNKPYLFFGSHLQNSVDVVPRIADLASRTYAWGRFVQDPYEIKGYPRWRRNLERLRIGFVVIMRSDAEDPERHWMLQRPQGFRRVYEDIET